MATTDEAGVPRWTPTAQRPLLGLTILLVEDSRYASEAIRLMCLRSGARLRRADSLAAAHRHLSAYRPAAAIVDLGLPDGSGLDLIRELAAAPDEALALLATSGDPGAEDAARAAGARAFLAKPLGNLGQFQESILAVLPPEARPTGPRGVAREALQPDPIALRDDLDHVAMLLRSDGDPGTQSYAAGFLAGVGRDAADAPLAEAAEAAAQALRHGATPADRQARIARLRQLIDTRLAAPVSVTG